MLIFAARKITSTTMKAKEPMANASTASNVLIPHLRSNILEKVETENDLNVLEQVYAIVAASKSSFTNKYYHAKEQTEHFCTSEVAEELEAEGYMIDKPYPYDDSCIDFNQLIEDDANDTNAPQEWVEKMFPELYA